MKYVSMDENNNFLLSLNLFKYNDKNKYIKTLYGISNNTINNYNVYKIKKRNGNLRTICEPKPLLKQIQKQILNKLLNNKEISKYAKAYHKGISLKDNALPHLNKDIILKLDIKDFFDSISFNLIYDKCFAYYPKQIGLLLTYLCAYEDCLPQGAPTSSYISNLVMKSFDTEIGLYCDNHNISYTRYSDDLTFSGNFNPSEIISIVRKKLYKLGLKLNNKKIHIIHKSSSQNVTGIVVNEKIQVNYKYRHRIRQEIYYIQKYGIDSHLKMKKVKMDTKKYLNHLYGKILYVLQINKNDLEFINYKQIINDLKKRF